MKVTILGTQYDIIKRNYNEDAEFHERDIGAYCDIFRKKIICCKMITYPGWENADDCLYQEKSLLKHEILHAFLYESGLDINSSESGSWAANEEMVDWFALQSPKIFKVYKELELLDI